MQVLLVSLALASLSAGAATLPKESPKVRRAEAIFDALLSTHGRFNRQQPAPRLLIEAVGTKGRSRIAWTDPARNAVVIEEELYDLLRDTDRVPLEDGLAFVLGHELAHVFLHPGWRGDFGQGMAQRVPRSLRRHRSGADLEGEADEVGAFFAFVSGFDSLSIGPQVVDAIYDAYGLDTQITGYPSREERRAVAARTSPPARAAAATYAAGILFASIGEHALASRLLEDLSGRYPSLALLDAAAVASALRAEAIEGVGYALPLGFVVPRGIGDGALPKGPLFAGDERARLLDAAVSRLRAAQARDPDHPEVALHLASVFLLKKDVEAAVETARFARARAAQLTTGSRRERALGEASVLAGVARALQGDRAQAEKHFAEAARLGSEVGAVNLNLLKGRPIPRAVAHHEVGDAGDSPLDPSAESRTLPCDERTPVTLRWPAEALTPSRIEVAVGRLTFHFEATRAEDGARTRAGIRKGMGWDELKERYGRPASVLTHGRGHFAQYGDSKKGLIFHLSEDDRVWGWWIYQQRVEEP